MFLNKTATHLQTERTKYIHKIMWAGNFISNMLA